jgi:hypothetical protein
MMETSIVGFDTEAGTPDESVVPTIDEARAWISAAARLLGEHGKADGRSLVLAFDLVRCALPVVETHMEGRFAGRRDEPETSRGAAREVA